MAVASGLNSLPAFLREYVSLDGPPLRGKTARVRLSASGPGGFLGQLGPPSVAGLCDWPASDYRELAAADEINHLGASEN